MAVEQIPAMLAKPALPTSPLVPVRWASQRQITAIRQLCRTHVVSDYAKDVVEQRIREGLRRFYAEEWITFLGSLPLRSAGPRHNAPFGRGCARDTDSL